MAAGSVLCVPLYVHLQQLNAAAAVVKDSAILVRIGLSMKYQHREMEFLPEMLTRNYI